MRRLLTLCGIVAVIIADYSLAAAMTGRDYGLLGESLYLIFALGGLAMTVAIFKALKGGSLEKPWLFILLALALAAVGSVIELLDLLKIIIHQYDMRPALLVFRTGSILMLLVGLFLYKKDLQ